MDENYYNILDMSNCDFENNDAGAVFDRSFTDLMASSIYIEGGFANTFKKVIIHDT